MSGYLQMPLGYWNVGGGVGGGNAEWSVSDEVICVQVNLQKFLLVV